MKKYNYYENVLEKVAVNFQQQGIIQNKTLLAKLIEVLYVTFKKIMLEEELNDKQKQALFQKLNKLVVQNIENLSCEYFVNFVINGNIISLNELIIAFGFFNEMLDLIAKDKQYTVYRKDVIAKLDRLIGNIYTPIYKKTQTFSITTSGIDQQIAAVQVCFMLIEQIGRTDPKQCSMLITIFYELSEIAVEFLRTQINLAKNHGNAAELIQLTFQVNTVYEMLRSEFFNDHGNKKLTDATEACLCECIPYFELLQIRRENKIYFEYNTYINNVIKILKAKHAQKEIKCTPKDYILLAQAHSRKLSFLAHNNVPADFEMLNDAYQALDKLPKQTNEMLYNKLLNLIVNGFIKAVHPQHTSISAPKEQLLKSINAINGCLKELPETDKLTRSSLQTSKTYLSKAVEAYTREELRQTDKLLKEFDKQLVKSKSTFWQGDKKQYKKQQKLEQEKLNIQRHEQQNLQDQQQQVKLLLSQCSDYMKLASQLAYPRFYEGQSRSLIWLDLKPSEYILKAKDAFAKAEVKFKTIANPEVALTIRLNETKQWLEIFEQNFPTNLFPYYNVHIDAAMARKIEAALSNKYQTEYKIESVMRF